MSEIGCESDWCDAFLAANLSRLGAKTLSGQVVYAHSERRNQV